MDGTEIDKAALLAEVYRRNALRRAAQLPPLDIQAEYEHACARAALAEYRRRVEAFAADRERIHDEVLAELRATRAPDFPNSMGSRLLVGQIVEQRFREFIRERLGLDRPPLVVRNPAIYGSNRREEERGGD